MSLSILIPAYNEENRIESTLKHLIQYFKQMKDLKIIVIFDGNDRTKDIIRSFNKKTKQNIRLYTFKHRLGKWGAIKEGIKKSCSDNIVFMDADEAVSSENVKKLFSIFEKNDCDILIASRYMKDSKILAKQSKRRIFFSRLFNLINKIMFNLNFNDTQCGCKFFSKKIGLEIISKMKTKGFEGDVEFLWLAKKSGYSIREEPVTWKHRKESKFKLNNGFRMLKNLLKIRFAY